MKEEKDILDYLKVNRAESPEASYFQYLAKEVNKSQYLKIIPFYQRQFFWIGSVAAVFIGVILTIGIGKGVPSSKNPLLALNEIPSAEIIQYVDENIDEFEIEEIASILSLKSLKSTDDDALNLLEEKETPPIIEPTVSLNEIDSDEILEYLEDEGIEPSDLDEIELI